MSLFSMLNFEFAAYYWIPALQLCLRHSTYSFLVSDKTHPWAGRNDWGANAVKPPEAV